MRLGQLARRLSVTPSEIVTLLRKNNIAVDEGANARIPDEAISMILARFAPGEAIAVEELQVEEEPAEETAQASPPNDVPAAMSADAPQDPAGEMPPVIKAPKVELKGLTVLGKIELPDKKETEKKEKEKPEDAAPASTSNGTSVEKPLPPRRHRGNEGKRSGEQPGRRRRDRERNNPIALQREAEARQAEEQKREKEKREKEKRTQHYYNRIKATAPARPTRIYEEHDAVVTEETDHKTRNLWQRLVKWFTS